VNQTSDLAADSGNFDPRRAAAVLSETTQQTRREIEPARPWLLTVRGLLVLGVGIVFWLSVRGQHPYTGPTTSVIPLAVTFGVLNTIVTLTFARRATLGIGGRSRLHPAEIALLAAAWIVPYLLMVPVANSGASTSVAYYVLPVPVPLIAAGLAWAGISAARRRRRPCGTGLAVAAVGVICLIAGPIAGWLAMGIGLCVVLLGTALVIVRGQRRGVVGA